LPTLHVSGAQVCSWEGRRIRPSAAGPQAGLSKINMNVCHDACSGAGRGRADGPPEGTLLMRAVLISEFGVNGN